MQELLIKQAKERIQKRMQNLLDESYMIYWDGEMPKDNNTFAAMLMHISEELQAIATDIEILLKD